MDTGLTSQFCWNTLLSTLQKHLLSVFFLSSKIFSRLFYLRKAFLKNLSVDFEELCCEVIYLDCATGRNKAIKAVASHRLRSWSGSQCSRAVEAKGSEPDNPGFEPQLRNWLRVTLCNLKLMQQNMRVTLVYNTWLGPAPGILCPGWFYQPADWNLSVPASPAQTEA